MICNEGYTIERFIHGMDAVSCHLIQGLPFASLTDEQIYNDIQQWKLKELVNVFGGEAKNAKTFQVKSKQEAHDLFEDKEFSAARYLQVCSPAMLTDIEVEGLTRG